jgi:hypothetical protein
MSRTNYWGDLIPAVRVRETWEYEHVAPDAASIEEGEPNGPYWIEEDDKMSALWKALGEDATGRIRSYTVTTAESAPVVQKGLSRDELLALYRQS